MDQRQQTRLLLDKYRREQLEQDGFLQLLAPIHTPRQQVFFIYLYEWSEVAEAEKDLELRQEELVEMVLILLLGPLLPVLVASVERMRLHRPDQGHLEETLIFQGAGPLALLQDWLWLMAPAAGEVLLGPADGVRVGTGREVGAAAVVGVR